MYSDQQANAGLFAPGDGVDIHEQSPLNLAFVGDGVWELLVRQRLVERTRLQPGRLHSEAVKYVSAKAQFQALARLEPLLTEQEQDDPGNDIANEASMDQSLLVHPGQETHIYDRSQEGNKGIDRKEIAVSLFAQTEEVHIDIGRH